MKKLTLLLAVVGVAAVAGAMYTASASGSPQSAGPTAKQFKALKKQVASLSNTVKALKAVVVVDTGVLVACDAHTLPIGQFGNPTGNPAEGYHYLLPSANPQEILTTALDVTSPSDPNAAFLTYGTSSCSTALGGALRHAAGKAGIRLSHASSHPSFLAHRP